MSEGMRPTCLPFALSSSLPLKTGELSKQCLLHAFCMSSLAFQEGKQKARLIAVVHVEGVTSSNKVHAFVSELGRLDTCGSGNARLLLPSSFATFVCDDDLLSQAAAVCTD